MQHISTGSDIMRDPIDIIIENLGRLLNETGLNQTQFGHKIGVDPSVISKLQGRVFKNPTLETLYLIVKPFNKSLRWLLTDHREIIVEDHTLDDCYESLGKAAGLIKPDAHFMSAAESNPPHIIKKIKK